MRGRLENQLPGAGAAVYERELAAELGLLMPWTWSDFALTLRQEARTFLADGLDPGVASANDRLGLYRYMDRRADAGDDWNHTVYSAGAVKRNWSLPGDPGNEVAEVELAADGFASWPALLATLARKRHRSVCAISASTACSGLPSPMWWKVKNCIVRK